MLIDVTLDGVTLTQMDEADLLKLEGGFENETEITTWVQYHLPESGQLVHRSAHVTLKPVASEAVAAQLG